MAISTFKRYEKKYLINSRQMSELMPLLLKYMDYDAYCRGGDKYTIYNIYYDSVNSDIIRENSNASSYKEKLRLRSYYPKNGPDDTVFLELKKKENGIGNKRRIALKQREVDDLLYRAVPPSGDSYLERQVTAEILYFLSNNPVRPAVYIQYDRLALFGREDGEFRMTFDDNIRARRKDFSFGPADDDELLLEADMYIMEVKFLGAMPVWLAKKLSEMSIFSRGFSKYGTEYKNRLLHRELEYYLIAPDGQESRHYEFYPEAN